MAQYRYRNSRAIVPAVAGLFFPLRPMMGFDARELTPGIVERITFAGAESRSFKRASIVMHKVGGQVASPKTIERVIHDVGAELARLRESASQRGETRHGAPTMPGIPPGGQLAAQSSSAPPDADYRPTLHGSPRKNVVVVMRGPDSAWMTVLIDNPLPDGRVEVRVMNRVEGRLVPGEKQTVQARELYHALPQRDL